MTTNGQQFFGSNETFFQYHQPPQLERILKSSGGRGGGTAVNLTFGGDTRAISGELATYPYPYPYPEPYPYPYPEPYPDQASAA